MKTIIISVIMLVMPAIAAFSQEDKAVRVPLIGETAPAFVAESTKGTIKFPDDYFGKWKILFSHPSDFTPVCTSEIIELAGMISEFDKLNSKIFIISTDGLHSHIEWVKSMESFSYKDRPPVKIDFPLIDDKSLEISKKYGMMHPYNNSTKDVRGIFIIDPEDHIRAIFFYPPTVGRNTEEIRRTLIALQLSEGKNVLTPANWEAGQDVMVDSPQTIKEADKMKNEKNPDMYSPVWYMWFKKMK